MTRENSERVSVSGKHGSAVVVDALMNGVVHEEIMDAGQVKRPTTTVLKLGMISCLLAPTVMSIGC